MHDLAIYTVYTNHAFYALYHIVLISIEHAFHVTLIMQASLTRVTLIPRSRSIPTLTCFLLAYFPKFSDSHVSLPSFGQASPP